MTAEKKSPEEEEKEEGEQETFLKITIYFYTHTRYVAYYLFLKERLK